MGIMTPQDHHFITLK